MLEIRNINKSFGRGSNSLKAIDNTSLKFNKGITALLGPSGSGKTTLLNVIGGLDSIDSGQIIINNEEMPRISSSKWQKARRTSIAYVFQHYHLINDKTVEENLVLAINIAGIYDQVEVSKRVNECLLIVGMSRYSKRLITSLSGGQQQRIAIARALTTNADILLCDEPTGNLDATNTFEVMNILRSISKEKTVILVTHEEDLANFYSDRIIRIKDGKVLSDEINDSPNREFYFKSDNDIYLKDLELSEFNFENTKVKVYTDNSLSLDEVSIDVASRNDVLYVKNNSTADFEVLSDQSITNVLDKKYESYTLESISNRVYNTSNFSNKNRDFKTSPIKILATFREYFSNVKRPSIMKIISTTVVFLISVTISMLVFFLAVTTNTPDIYNTYFDDESITLTRQNTDKFFEHIDDNPEVLDYIYYFNSPRSLSHIGQGYYSYMPVINDELSKKPFVGEVSKKLGTVVLEKELAKNICRDLQPNSQCDYDLLIGRKIYMLGRSDFIVTGIVDNGRYNAYINYEDYMRTSSFYRLNHDAGYYYVDIEEKDMYNITTVDTLPENTVAVNKEYESILPIGYQMSLTDTLENITYTVGGYYETTEPADIYMILVNENEYNEITRNAKYSQYEYVITHPWGNPPDEDNPIAISSSDASKLRSILDEEGISYVNTSDYLRDVVLKEPSILVTSINVIIAILAILLGVLLTSKLSKLNYEIAVLKSLGAKTKDITKRYFILVVLTTYIVLLLGMLFATYIFVNLEEMLQFIAGRPRHLTIFEYIITGVILTIILTITVVAPIIYKTYQKPVKLMQNKEK